MNDMIEVPVPYPQNERKVALGMIDERCAKKWCGAIVTVDKDYGDIRVEFADGETMQVIFSWQKKYQPPKPKEYRQ